MRNLLPGERSVTPVVGNVLLVAVVVVIAVVLVVLSFSFLEGTGTPTAEASFEYEQTPVGLELRPTAIGTDVVIKLNGENVTHISADSAGESVLIPTAPGDRVSVVSTDGERSVLVNKQIDERSEVGDLIAYYPFDAGSGTTIEDTSGNGNDGQAFGGVTRTGTALDFNGSSGTYVDVGDLTIDGPDQVDEITIAIRYEHDGGSDIQNLIEHQDSNFAWFMETNVKHGDPHQMEFNVGYNSNPNGTITTGDVPSGEPQTVIGTYDGNQMVFYRNGQKLGTRSFQRDVALGQVIIGADSDPTGVGQNFDGRISEVRLYYAAFSESEVAVLNQAMSGDS
jgi:FlaG/FlaF family flagellin (archaellin)